MGQKVVCVVFIILAYFCRTVRSATILALLSSLSYSDHLVFRGYISLLSKSGHTLIVMTPYPGHFRHPEVENIVELDVGQASVPFWDEYKKLVTNTDDYYPRLKDLNEFSVKLAIAQLKSKQMVALLFNPDINFDLVITEADVPLLYAIAEKYKAPHISITASTGKIHQREAKGDSVNPFLYPDVNSLHDRSRSLWKLISEFYRYIQTKNEYYHNYLSLCELAAKKLLGLKKPLEEVESNVDLLFIASNPALLGQRLSVPAVIYVDRLHIRSGLNLPKGLHSLLDSAPRGVVYFSLGAIQEAEQLSTSILQTLADAFRELPFLVLWKIGNTTLFKKPDNVIAQTWFPQQQILAHPHVKAFITHGGQRSLEEAVFYEVPIIGFPNVKSRKKDIQGVTRHGAGEILDPYNLDKENVKEIISAVIDNKKYKLATTHLKQMIFDSNLSGPENAVWWTEFLLRHGTTRSLRAPFIKIGLMKYYNLDIFLFIMTAITICFSLAYLLKRTIEWIVRLVFRMIASLIKRILCILYKIMCSIIRRLRRRFLTRSDMIPNHFPVPVATAKPKLN